MLLPQARYEGQQQGIFSPVKTNAVINITSLSETNVASQQWTTFLEVISRSQQLNGNSITTTINIIIILTCYYR